MPSSSTTFGTANVVPLDLSVASGDITLTAEQSAILYIVLSGTLTADFHLVFPLLGVWQVDTTQVNLNGFLVHVVNGTGAASIAVPSITTVSVPADNIIEITAPLTAKGYVFRPGGGASGNVYTTEATLAAATQTAGGPYTIFFDLSLAPTPGFYTFETVGVLDLAPGGIWTDGGVTQGNGNPAQFSNQLTFQNGTVMPNPPSDVYGFIQIECNQPYPNICWESTASSGKTTFHDFTGAWCNAGMAPLISSVNDWLVVATDDANFNYGPVASGPLAAVDLDYLLQVNLYVAGQGNSSYMGPKTINFGFSAAGVGFIDPNLYPFMQLVGLFVDPTGTGNTTIPAPSAGTEETSLALLFCQGSTNTGTLYYSNGTDWVPIVTAPNFDAETFLAQPSFDTVTFNAQNAFTRQGSGVVTVTGVQSVVSNQAASVTMTFQLVVDGDPIGPAVPVPTTPASHGTAAMSITWIDTQTDDLPHTYGMQVTASAGTVGSAPGTGSVTFIEK